MLKTAVFSILMQLQTAPEEFYVPAVSEETRAALTEAEGAPVEETIRKLETLAEQGDDSAFELLGEMFNGGLGSFPRDAKRACDYFEQIGDRRADGLHNQATCYYAGDGRKRDLAKARELYLKAAEAGWRSSFCAYGNMLIAGEGGPTDQSEGVRLCRMSAVAGDPDAQTDYGGYLLMGVGVERDPVTARFMLEQAGVQKQRNAAFLLGQIYQKGDGVEASSEMSREWFERAYEWGRPGAAFEVALNYARRGFRKEGENMFANADLLRTAIQWFEIAAEQDPDPGKREQAIDLIENTKKLIIASEN
ncbi:MAG: tetratricopeptide repeat protein [Pseudomonadota bacterium]